ncbi:MAG: extracellular solute-binding protein [Pseudorhodoplanes sp.]
MLRRRDVLRGASYGALWAAAGPSTYVFAQENSVTVTANGGKWEQSIREHFVPHFKKRTGAEVKVVVGTPPQWMAQIDAQRSRPSIDTLCNSETLAISLMQKGLTQPLTVEKVPNLKDIPDQFRKPFNDHGASFLYSTAGLFYNKQRIKDVPKTWPEFFERTARGDFGQTVALPDISYGWTPQFLWHYAQALGGGIKNFDPAFEALKKMKKNVVKFYSTGPEVERLISAQEADIGILWDGRTTALADETPFLGFTRPGPNSLLSLSIAQVVKGGNERLAYEWVNTMMAPEPQLQFFKLVNFAPTNKTVVIPPELKERAAPLDIGVTAPYTELTQVTPTLVDRWNREIRGG